MLGFRSLEFMGYELGNGSLKPETGKVSKILDIEVPRTKTQVRAIMGLINYYLRFVPNFAAITAPLSDLEREAESSGDLGYNEGWVTWEIWGKRGSWRGALEIQSLGSDQIAAYVITGQRPRL
ncbi:Retrovirus-related Pol polyprotein from transposon 17.6 [Biomphalaria pfeifferi]|uniref:Retrovirus-related Pol polyprotein from transposon 17.6 n=1 Tax=Biomphalaria pfeifferi TaxID=112525 RepID=A0AAD8BYX8_BIOPF|nr:Retrovirus-related Pol polyprotein from transposon 17.6 [Biomphalaria pfeifferi]